MECSRFREENDPVTDFQTPHAMNFLKLRNDGCKKRAALKFSVTPRC